MGKSRDTYTAKEYFIWSNKSEILYPWERQYVDWDFLAHEKKRIDDISKWYKTFQKVDYKDNNVDISLYAVPVELSSSWKAAIVENNMNYMGLATLPNSPQHLLMCLIPYDKKQPQEYGPIKITSSKRIRIYNKHYKEYEYALVIEDWEPLKSDFIYIDVPYEKQIINNILKETLIDDKKITSSLQAPIISAPYLNGALGGISLSSFSLNSPLGKELVKSISLLVPPEYRAFRPPEKAYMGKKFQYSKGIKFHLAEKPIIDDKIFSGIVPSRYDFLDNELFKRVNFQGEYSIFSTFSPGQGYVTQLMKEFLTKYPNTDITLPLSLDNLLDSKINIAKLKKEINEDIWMQVVFTRQFQPGLDKKSSKHFNSLSDLLYQDYDTLLSEIYKNSTEREHVVKSMHHKSKYNLKRLAQSLARVDENNSISENNFEKARGIIVDNFTDLVNHKDVHKFADKIKTRKENERYSVIQTEIINSPSSTAMEIFNEIEYTGLFKDIYDLQSLLDWLIKNGHITENEEKRYQWSPYHVY